MPASGGAGKYLEITIFFFFFIFFLFFFHHLLSLAPMEDLDALIGELASMAVSPGADAHSPDPASLAAEIERVAAGLDDAEIADADARIDGVLLDERTALVPSNAHVIVAFAQDAARCVGAVVCATAVCSVP
jgi:hypothetical protein